MALKKFIGARYAPQFMGEWNQATQYAALSVVYTDQRSYVSRKTVPAGTEITNQEFWIQSSDWNAQVAQYNQKVDAYNTNVEKYNKNVEDYEAAVSAFYADTMHSFDTKAEMQADKTLKLGETLLTCGDKSIGDGGGSFYQVVAETSTTAVALDNGLYALPFEFQPYDYSQFVTEVEQYKATTDAQIAKNQADANAEIAEVKAVSLKNYDNKAAMIADTKLEDGNTVLTSGTTSVGDGGGGFWKVKDQSSDSSAVVLSNGKKAVPFSLEVYDNKPYRTGVTDAGLGYGRAFKSDSDNYLELDVPFTASEMFKHNTVSFEGLIYTEKPKSTSYSGFTLRLVCSDITNDMLNQITVPTFWYGAIDVIPHASSSGNFPDCNYVYVELRTSTGGYIARLAYATVVTHTRTRSLTINFNTAIDTSLNLTAPTGTQVAYFKASL